MSARSGSGRGAGRGSRFAGRAATLTRGGGGSATMVMEAETPAAEAGWGTSSSSSSSADMEAVEALTTEQLFVALDVATRSDRQQVVNTIQVILKRAGANAALKLEYVRKIILIGFKRRNHEKSQADGTGAGEKDILRTFLLTLHAAAPDSVKAVLPLVPLYGSWKDLNLIAERCCQETMEGDDLSSLPELSEVIARLFAEQLLKDQAAQAAAASGEGSAAADIVLPSNACKYAFSENRHRRSANNRGAAKASRDHKIQGRLATRTSEAIFRTVNEDRLRRPAYRRMLSGLRKVLTDKGFMVESLMTASTPDRIWFRRAPKGSLEKYKAAINRDPAAKQKWLQAMKSSQNAVADIDSIPAAAADARKEVGEPVAGRRVLKAIASMKAAREGLKADVQQLVDQLRGHASNEQSERALEVLNSTIFPIVDTLGCASQGQVDALLLAAYIVARAEGCAVVGFNGNLIHLSPEPEPASAAVAAAAPTSKRAHKNPPPAQVTDAELYRAMEWLRAITGDENVMEEDEEDEVPAQGQGNAAIMNWQDRATDDQVMGLALQASCAKYHAARANGAAAQASAPVDAMLLCVAVPEDTTALEAALEFVQNDVGTGTGGAAGGGAAADAGGGGRNFRSVLVHKLKAEHGKTEFKMRSAVPVLPPAAELVIDVVIMMDFTGSMGSWMQQAKQHVGAIMASLKHETSAKEVRVAFVGYRDYKDPGRVVVKEFVTAEACDGLLRTIMGEQPSGGGDEPEDVLSAVLALNDLDWRGHLRVCLHVCDATAHGYCTSLNYVHDNYPSGKCPDQLQGPSLAEACATLADTHKVDMMMCECNPDRTVDLKHMYEGIYGTAAGFGVLPLADASRFKEKILEALSSAMLALMVSDKVSGLQSFSGHTLSALISTTKTSLRESVAELSVALEEGVSQGLFVAAASSSSSEAAVEEGAEAAAAPGAVKEEEEEEEDDDDDEKEEEEEEEEEGDNVSDAGPDAEAAEEEEEEEEDAKAAEAAEGETEEEKAVRALSAASTGSDHPAKKKGRPARTDHDRLEDELRARELNPVRLMLGMPLAESMALMAGRALLEGGLSVHELQALGYPPSIIQVFVQAATSALKEA